jgi:hypothetical protein
MFHFPEQIKESPKSSKTIDKKLKDILRKMKGKKKVQKSSSKSHRRKGGSKNKDIQTKSPNKVFKNTCESDKDCEELGSKYVEKLGCNGRHTTCRFICTKRACEAIKKVKAC